MRSERPETGRNGKPAAGEDQRRGDDPCRRSDTEILTGTPLGRLDVVSLGPGDACLLTPESEEALRDAEVIVGYHLYVDLVPEELREGKEIIATGMMGEMQRTEAAVRRACEGARTAVVCSGDAGIYALAGLVWELAETMQALDSMEIRVLPGVPALCAAAALLGAPLMHDFAVISLSDLLTPWELIEKRLHAAGSGDFVTVLYNPRSKRRDWQLDRALEILGGYRDPDTPLGLVRQAYRPDQFVHAGPLEGFQTASVDMVSILIVGNSQSRLIRGRLVTPRGYLAKYGDSR